jgi:hypothetical protein
MEFKDITLDKLTDDELISLTSLIHKEKERRVLESYYIIDPTLAETERASYADGYLSGYNWPDKWETHGKPGGPAVYGGRNEIDARRSLRANTHWRRGWDDGHTAKVKHNRSVTLEERNAIPGL